jgi:hypothetical protein
MRGWRLLSALIGIGLLSGCGSGSWVHPLKPEEAFAEDYNRCESDVLKDPKLQQGNKYLILQATERCMMKKGWMLRSEME